MAYYDDLDPHPPPTYAPSPPGAGQPARPAWPRTLGAVLLSLLALLHACG